MLQICQPRVDGSLLLIVQVNFQLSTASRLAKMDKQALLTILCEFTVWSLHVSSSAFAFAFAVVSVVYFAFSTTEILFTKTLNNSLDVSLGILIAQALSVYVSCLDSLARNSIPPLPLSLSSSFCICCSERAFMFSILFPTCPNYLLWLQSNHVHLGCKAIMFLAFFSFKLLSAPLVFSHYSLARV